MKQIQSYFSPITMKSSGTLSPLSAAQKEHRKLLNLYWDYYRGKHRKALKVSPGQPDDNITQNWSKVVVNRGVSFLFGKGVAFKTDDNQGRNQEEEHLDKFWSNDPRRDFSPAVFLQKFAQNGGVSGTAVLRIYPAKEWEEFPTVRVIDSRLVDIITDVDDIDHVIEYHITWLSGDDWKRHRFVEQENRTWEIVEEIRDGIKWREINAEPWPYTFPPVKHCQNLVMANQQIGASDLTDSDLNDAINTVESNTNRIIRFHAHPKTIVTGLSKKQFGTDNSIDSVWFLENSEAGAQNLEMQSDLQSSMEHARNQKGAFNMISGVPSFDPNNNNLGTLSGFALQILYGPLLEKTDIKRETYGALLQWLNRAILILGGKNDVVVENVWPYPLPVSSKERAEEFEILARIEGVDTKEAALVAGYDESTASRLTADGDLILVPDEDEG